MPPGFQTRDGKFLVGAGGFAVHEDCCCPANPCAACLDTPLSLTVTFAGLILNGACCPLGGGVWGKATALNMGVVECLITAGDCVWGGVAPNALTIEYFSDAACTVKIGETTYDVDVGVHYALAFFTVPDFQFVAATVFVGDFGEQWDVFFEVWASSAVPFNCKASQVRNNTLAGCPGVAGGGTATIVD